MGHKNTYVYLIDSCVLIRGLEGKGAAHEVTKRLLDGDPSLALTDFTLHELELRGSHHLRKRLKEKEGQIRLYETGIRPGEWSKERTYEISIDPELLELVPDPSDAVLVASAEHYGLKGIITEDRHHLYTAKLGNYLEKIGIEVLKPNEYIMGRDFL